MWKVEKNVENRGVKTAFSSLSEIDRKRKNTVKI